ncbi:hypothetical protein B0H19DRAFT_1134523 [Mycena capillaripes]|nr:hypothetical protein B0H19DRAFT_1134523 [Mycena capillaripes]
MMLASFTEHPSCVDPHHCNHTHRRTLGNDGLPTHDQPPRSSRYNRVSRFGYG